MRTEELERADYRNGDAHEDELIDIEIVDSCVPQVGPCGRPSGEYMTRPEVGKLMEDNIKTGVGVATKSVITGVVEETREEEFFVGHDEQKE